MINLYRPKFNYKHGGQGKFINREFTYAVVKNGKTLEGKQSYSIQSMFRRPLVQSVDYDYLKDICLKLNNGELTPDEVMSMKREIIPSPESKIKASKATNSTGFFRVRKEKDKTCKQGFLWTYEFYNENKKHKKIRRVNFFELKKEVEKQKMIWKIIDLDKAIDTVRSIVAI